jgi:hypothetical protein
MIKTIAHEVSKAFIEILCACFIRILFKGGSLIMNKKIISIMLIIALILLNIQVTSQPTYAKKTKVTLSAKNISIKKGDKKTLTLKNTKKKVKWKIVSGKKNIRIVKCKGKNKNKVVIKALKIGKAVVCAKYENRTYKVKILVKNKNNTPIEAKKEVENTVISTTTENTINQQYATVTFDFLGYAENITKQIKIGEPYGELPSIQTEQYMSCGWHTKDEPKSVLETDICLGDTTLYVYMGYFGAVEDETTMFLVD